MSFDFNKMFDADEKIDRPNDLIERVKKAGSAAKRCLNSVEFEDYRNQFIKAEAAMVSAMIAETNDFFIKGNGDMAFYGAKMARMITKLNDLRTLLDQVYRDNARLRLLETEKEHAKG